MCGLPEAHADYAYELFPVCRRLAVSSADISSSLALITQNGRSNSNPARAQHAARNLCRGARMPSIAACDAGSPCIVERSEYAQTQVDSRRAPRARPASRLTLAPRAWHRPQKARTAPVGGRRPQPQPVSRPLWPHVKRCSTACGGRLRSCAQISIRSLWQMRSWRQS